MSKKTLSKVAPVEGVKASKPKKDPEGNMYLKREEKRIKARTDGFNPGRLAKQDKLSKKGTFNKLNMSEINEQAEPDTFDE